MSNLKRMNSTLSEDCERYIGEVSDLSTERDKLNEKVAQYEEKIKVSLQSLIWHYRELPGVTVSHQLISNQFGCTNLMCATVHFQWEYSNDYVSAPTQALILESHFVHFYLEIGVKRSRERR